MIIRSGRLIGLAGLVVAAGWWLGVGGCRRAGEGGPVAPETESRTYDPKSDPLVNPDSLLKPPPEDAGAIAWNETLYGCLKTGPRMLNPLFAATDHELRVTSLLYDALFVVDARMEWAINEAMVESYEESADHLSAVVRLKEGLLWHDGHGYSAADVVFSWQQIRDERVPCAIAKGETALISNCEAVDDRTIRFTFSDAFATNRWNLMFGVIPKHVFERYKDDDPTLTRSDYYQFANRQPVGNGPYQFVEWRTDDQIVLRRWSNYSGRNGFFEQVVFRIVPDPNVRLLMFEKGEIDEFEMTPDQFVMGSAGARFAEKGVKGYGSQAKYTYICWNQDGSNPFFDDVGVRRAMCHAIDYERIARQIYYGVYTQSHGLFEPGELYYNDEIKLYEFELKRAAELLDEAGWRIDAKDGWRYKTVKPPTEAAGDADGGVVGTRRRFAFSLNVPVESKTIPDIAAIMKEDLARIGVDMSIGTMEYSTLMQRNREHAFEASASAWTTGGDPDSAANLWSSEAYADGRNYGGFRDPRVDELFQLARRCFDTEQRRSHYAEIAKLVYESSPYAFLVHQPVLWAFSKRLSGVGFSARGPCHFYPGTRNWWVSVDHQSKRGR